MLAYVRDAWLRWVVTAAAAYVLYLGSETYYPFISDDALISLRYADRWLAGGGLTWDDFAPVEGYSNFLWVCSTALLGKLGVDLILALRVLGGLCTGGALLVIASAARGRGMRGALALVPALALFATSGNVQVWVIGGLEQPRVLVLLLWGLRCLADACETGRRVSWYGASGSLMGLVLARPDGPIFAAGFALSLLLRKGWSRRVRKPLLWLVLPALVTFLVHTGFRWLYYDDFLPNTARIKLPFSTARMEAGLAYVEGWARGQRPLLVYAACALLAAAIRGWRNLARTSTVPAVFCDQDATGCVADEPKTPSRSPSVRPLAARTVSYGSCERPCLRSALAPLAITLPSMALWAGYVIFIGGDIFPAHRHMVVMSGMLCLTLALLDAPVTSFRWLAVAVPAGIALAHWQHGLQAGLPENVRARNERWEWDCASFARELGRSFKDEQPLIGVYAAGCFGYFSRLPAVDLLGLNDRSIARRRPEDADTRSLGHGFGAGEADYRYLVERNADLVFRHIGRKKKLPPVLRHDKGQFYPVALYTNVRKKPHWGWFNRDSNLRTAQVASGRISYPGLALQSKQVSFELRHRHVFYRLDKPARLDLSPETVPAGKYRVNVFGWAADRVRVQCGDNTGRTLEMQTGRAGVCEFQASRGRPPLIRQVVLTPQL